VAGDFFAEACVTNVPYIDARLTVFDSFGGLA